MPKSIINHAAYKMLHVSLFQKILELTSEAQQAGLLQSETLLGRVEQGLSLQFLLTELGWQSESGLNTSNSLSLSDDLIKRINSFARSANDEDISFNKTPTLAF